MNKGQLYVFAGADRWRCVLTDKKSGMRGMTFTTGPEEHIRSFLRDLRVKKACVILSSESAVLRFARLPLIKAQDINKAISFLNDENFPVDKDKYIFGYKILGKDLEKYSLLLAALPAGAVSGLVHLFDNMGVTIETLGLFEGAGGISLSEFVSILVFIRQETSWRVIWMKNKTPIDIWRVSDPGDIDSLFAELDFGETIENAVFYSTPEPWLTEACEEYGLTVSEVLDADEVFNACGESVNMLPGTYKRGKMYRRVTILSVTLLLISAAAMFFAALTLNTRTDGLRARQIELSAQIRSLNDEINNRPAKLPVELEADASAYGRALKVLTERLPPETRIQRVFAAENALSLAVDAGGSDWLNKYIDDCESFLNLRILTSKIAREKDVTEIELLIEMR